MLSSITKKFPDWIDSIRNFPQSTNLPSWQLVKEVALTSIPAGIGCAVLFSWIGQTRMDPERVKQIPPPISEKQEGQSSLLVAIKILALLVGVGLFFRQVLKEDIDKRPQNTKDLEFQAGKGPRVNRDIDVESEIPTLESFHQDCTTVVQQYAQEFRLVPFYNFDQDRHTAWLGNFSEYPVPIQDKRFPTAENAFQAAKFPCNPEIVSEFTSCSPSQAFQLAKQIEEGNPTFLQDTGWHGRKYEVMKDVLRKKLEANPELLEMLRATGDSYIVERNPGIGTDSEWSDGKCGQGKNLLGRAWMELRKENRGTGIVDPPRSYEFLLRYMNDKKHPGRSISQSMENISPESCRIDVIPF